MRKFSRIVSLFIALTLFFAIPAQAVEANDSKSSNFFLRTGCFLHKTGERTFEVWFDLTCLGTMQQLGSTYIQVQRSSNGTSGWTPIRTYTPDGHPQMLKNNGLTYTNCVSFGGFAGYYYRAYIEFYATNSSGSGYAYMYTETIKI